jgi:AcrR family transcriptional regulator
MRLDLSVTESPTPEGREGLRARKKRAQRRQLSDTATRLFLQHGFDGVRVAQIAQECDVSESTVFNYFPTKESLLLDRLEPTAAALVAAIGESGHDPVIAVVDALDRELGRLLDSAAAQGDESVAIQGVHRFGELVRTTPSIRAHLSGRKDNYTTAAAAALVTRYGLDEGDPRAQIAAIALVGLWQVQSDSLLRATGAERSVTKVTRRVERELRAAARVVSAGLATPWFR